MYPCGVKWGRDAARVFVVFALVAAIFRPVSGSADGALAIALPPDVVKQGFAYGYVTDYPDTNQADAQALKKCRDTTIEGVRPLCDGHPRLQEPVRRRRHGSASRNAGRRLVRRAGLARGGGSSFVEVRRNRRSGPPRRLRDRSFVM